MAVERDLDGWTVAFDLDGTLVDSAPDLIGTLNRLLADYDLPPRPVEAARHLVGHGAMALLRDGFLEAGAAWDEARAPGLFDRFIADYRAHIADHSQVFDGVVEALDQLAARGAILCVATNKRTDLSVALIQALGLARHFAFVAGPDAVDAKKPDGEHIRRAVQRAGGDPARAIMVGDSTTDTAAARDAGVPCAVVSFGYNDVPRDRLGGDVTIDHYATLNAVVSDLVFGAG